MTKASNAETKQARRKKIGVIVLGMHRSGTSAMGGVLNLLGCDAPATLMAPHNTNPKGFFESQVLYKLNTDILNSAGSNWSDWQPFNPGWFESPKAEMFRESVQKAMEAEFPGSRLFVLKDPRLCKLLPLYLDVFAEMEFRPAVVHIHRNPMEVAASLETRDKIEPALGQLIWLRHVLDAETNSRGLQRSFLSYDQLLRNWGGVTDRLGKALKINWPRLSTKAGTDIDAFLTPTLRHYERPIEQVLDNPLVSGWVRDTFAILQRWAESGEVSADHAALDRINAELTRSSSTFARLIDLGQAAAEHARKIDADLGAARTALSEKQSALAELQAQAGELEQKLSAAESQNATVDDLKSEIAHLNSALLQRQHEADDWANKALAAEEQRDAQAAQFVAKDAENAHELAALAKEILRLEEAAASARIDHEAASRRHQDETARLNAEVTKTAEALQAEKAALAEVRKQATRQTREIATLAQELTKAEDALDADRARAEAEALRLRRSLEDQASELALYSDHLRKARAAEAELRALSQEKDADTAARLSALAAERAHLQQVRDSLLTSTSWKITAPLRRVVRLLRGQR